MTKIHDTQSWLQYDKTTGQVIARVSSNSGVAPTETEQYGYIEGALPPGSWQVDLNTKEIQAVTPPPNPWWIQRRREYPSLEEFIDAYYWSQNGDPSRLADYLNQVKTVKAKYPKPNGGNNGG